MSVYQDQIGATLTRKDGAVMAYDILGARHFATNQIPIVLIGGLSSIRGDWERLAYALAEFRPILLLDHRGMGDSTYSLQGDEEITIELYARDILDLLIHLQWKRVAICGFSMGGLVAQQFLLLPYHTSNPTPPHPFEVTHVFLTGTMISPSFLQDGQFGLQFHVPPPPPDGRKRTKEEKMEIARVTLERTFDESWLSDPGNKERFNVLLERMIYGRPVRTILQQIRAIRNVNFNATHSSISKSIPILVVHGQNDLMVPYSCSADILSSIPHAKAVSVGSGRGQVPSLRFGHQWYEYFDIQVWVGVVEEWMKVQGGGGVEAKL